LIGPLFQARDDRFGEPHESAPRENEIDVLRA
jgi:hypothetical protein